MSNSLDVEILDALEQFGIRIRTVLRISSFHSPEIARKTYRINHDGGIVKARLLEDESTAGILADFRSELPEEFARILSLSGRVLIEEWIEGDPLTDVPEPHLLTTAGTLLADLHARQTVQNRALHEMHPTTDHLLAAQKCLHRLVSDEVLPKDVATRLELTMKRSNPLSAISGLVHLDFCGENMVIDRSGRLRLVDNERIGLDSLAYDLARTWYRWALPADAWKTFFISYTTRLPFPNPMDSFSFWKIVVAARSAELRLRALPEKVDVSLSCLRTLAEEEQT
jgi:hypothetical protein